jgi:hypothetical protein
MALTTVLTVSVRPDRASTYEARVHSLAERALAQKEPLEWAAHQVAAGALGTFHFVSQAESWAALGAREPIDLLIRKVMGDTEGAQLLEQLSECIVSERYTIGEERPDLSQPPEGDEMKPMSMVTLLRARPGGQDALEELIRKVAQAIPLVQSPRRFRAYQTVIGDMRTYWAATPLDGLGDLDALLPPAELLHRAFGAEGALIYRNGLDAIETFTRQITALRPELSNGVWVPPFIARMPARAVRPGAEIH